MLYFARTKIVQERSPPLVFFKILGDVFGEENVSGIAAIHHPLRHVNPGAGETGPFVYIDNPADWAAVDSHPKLQARMFPERAADLHRALRRRFRTRVKYQRHAVTSWNFIQPNPGFSLLKLF
jgi:hypothetical protein